MVAYRTGSNPIEIGNLGSKVKVTVTENVCKMDEKKIAKNSNLDIFEILDWKFYCCHLDTKYDYIAQKIIPKIINEKF